MNILDRAKLAYHVIRKDSQGLNNSINGLVARNYSKGASFNPEYQLKGYTYKAIDKIGESMSVYEPKITKPNGDYIENNPFYNLFNTPNPIQSNPSDFIHLWSMINEIYGETFWYFSHGELTGKIKEIYLLDPTKVELKFYEGELIGYVLHKDNGVQVPLLLDEIYHDKYPNPFNQWRGMSVLEKSATYVDTEIITSDFTLNYMKNNASPSGIVSLPLMEQSAFTQFTQQWRENYEGPQNAGKTAFIRGGEASFKAVGATLKDIDQKVTREMAVQDVLAMFGVPKGLLGLSADKGLGKSELESLEYAFSKHKLEPTMKRLDRIYTNILVKSDKRNVGNKITHASIIPEDKEYQHKIHVDLVGRAITPNEVRADLGLEPLPDGDSLDDVKAVQQVSEIKTISLKKQATAEEIKKLEELKPEEHRAKLVQNSKIYEIKLKRAISKFAVDQQRRVIGNINASSKSFEEWLFRIEEESVELARILYPLLEELIVEQSKNTTNFITGEPFEITPEFRKVTNVRITQIAGVYNKDTLVNLEKTLAEGQSKGESLMKLKKRVEETYDGAKGYRAERIARTESLRTANATAEAVYKQNGYTKVKWFINPNACEFCRTMANVEKTIGDNYFGLGDVIKGDEGGEIEVAYSDIETPPLHPNCTCSLIAVR